MKRVHLIFLALLGTFALFLLVKGSTSNFASPETIALPSFEAGVSTFEASSSESFTIEVVTEYVTQEVPGYKDVPWGSDFAAFKEIKTYSGNIGPQSASFIGLGDDNYIALLLGVPASDRVMFEYLPKKFSSVYFEPEDTWYIFYEGRLAIAFADLNEKNLEIYRDTFYKKYKKTGNISKKYSPAKGKTCRLEASVFEKSGTAAFLLKSTVTQGKKSSVAVDLIFADRKALEAIRAEIKNKVEEKSKQNLNKDLNKID